MKRLKKILVIVTILLLGACGSDDNNTPATPPDYANDFVGLWEFDTPVNYADAIYFGANGEAHPVYYGELNTTHLTIADFNTYEFLKNQVTYFRFGVDPVPYNGGNTLAFPGNGLTKVAGVHKISDFVEILSLDKALEVDVTAFLSDDSYNNLDGFGDQLLVPNPTADEGRYLRFQKSNLNFVETVTGINQTSTSIGVYDTNPFELLSVMEPNKMRLYQPSNPAFHPALDNIPLILNRYRCHTVTNNSGYDYISYNRILNSFNYHNVSILHKQQGVSEFAFYNLPPYGLRIKGMDYVEGHNKLIVSDSYNIHIFNIGFNTEGNDVSIFQHERTLTIVPSQFGSTFGQIQGIYLDANEDWLFMVLKWEGKVKLVRTFLEI